MSDQPKFKCFKLPQDIDQLRSWIFAAENKFNAKWAFHNGKFDTVRMLYNYGIDMKISHDTMILAYLCSTVDELKDNRGKWLGLKYAAPRILGVENWDIATSKKTSKTDEDVIPYLEKDCQYTYELLETLMKELPVNRRKTYKLIIEALNAYKYVELNGLPIDMDALEETYNDYKQQSEDIAKQLTAYADINYNSPIQLQKLLFEDLQLPIISYTDKGAPSTGVSELKRLRDKHPIVDLLLKHREVEKALTFLVSWKESAVKHDDGFYYVHSNFNLHGTVTGRTSSSDVNLQQVPRNKKLKSLFKATMPGWELACLDFSQLELRFAGIVADVEAIKDSYRNGVDLHKLMASKVAGCSMDEVTKEMRTQAKAINFGFIYGMQAASFVDYARDSYGVNVTLEESTMIRQAFFDLYPELNVYYQKVEDDLMNYCKQTSIMGRDYEINANKLANPYNRSNYIRAGINFPVQSAGSDYVICGLIEVINDPQLRDKIRGCATVHDSIIFLVKKDNIAETVTRVQQIMQKPKLAQQLLTKKIDIPIVVDIELGPLGKGVDLDEYLKQQSV
jgi:DNA polymerase-1